MAARAPVPDPSPEDRAVAHQLITIAEEHSTGKNALKLPTFSVHGLAPWSVSKYKLLVKCPFAFYLRYVLKIYDRLPATDEPVDAVITEDSVRTMVGSTAHNLLEVMLKENVPFEDAFEKVITPQVRDAVPEQFWYLIEDLRIPCKEFFSRIELFKARNPVKEVKVEGNMAVDKDWNPVGFNDPQAFLRALLDLRLVMENGDVVTIDHKLGGDPSWGLRNYELQLSWYSALEVGNEPDARSVTSGIHFVQAMDVLMGKKVRREYIQDSIQPRAYSLIENAVYAVKDAGTFPAVKTTSCAYCEVRDLCSRFRTRKEPAGLLQPIQVMSGKCL